MAGILGASSEAPRRTRAILLGLVRWGAVATSVVLSLLGLGWIGLQVFPEWMAASGWAPPRTGLGLLTELIVIVIALLVGAGTLQGLRLWETRARAARYQTWLREREEVQRVEAETLARVEAERPEAPEAILVFDLVQSTELIRDQGDAFFRDLLRRIETAFIPVARQYGTRCVDGHGDGFLFCFERAEQALGAARGMYARLPALNQLMPAGVEVAFRASLHVGPTFRGSRGNRSGLAVLKTVRLGSVMEALHGRGAGKNCLVLSEEALEALGETAGTSRLLGRVTLRGFPGTHPVYQLEV